MVYFQTFLVCMSSCLPGHKGFISRRFCFLCRVGYLELKGLFPDVSGVVCMSSLLPRPKGFISRRFWSVCRVGYLELKGLFRKSLTSVYGRVVYLDIKGLLPDVSGVYVKLAT